MRPLHRALLPIVLATMLSGCGAFAIPPIQGQGRVLTARLLVDVEGSQRRAVDLAVQDIRAAHFTELDNVAIQEVYADDRLDGDLDPAAARQRLRQLLAEDTQRNLLGMIGPLNQDVARAELAVANKAQLVVVSPDLTSECLTQARLYCAKGEPNVYRPYKATLQTTGELNFVRVCSTIDIQGPAIADYAFDSLGRHSAYILSDDTTTSKTLVDGFTQRWAVKGGILQGATQLDLSALADMSSTAALARLGKPELVFFATGDRARFADLARRLAGAGGPVVFGDERVYATASLTAQPAVDGAYVSSLAIDAEHKSPRFFAHYRARYNEAPAPYAVQAYQATMAWAFGLRSAVAAQVQQQSSGLPFRRDVRNGVHAASVDTEDLSQVSFDDHGDNTSRLVTFYEGASGAWGFKDQTQFAD